jgi:hypothetical protein
VAGCTKCELIGKENISLLFSENISSAKIIPGNYRKCFKA